MNEIKKEKKHDILQTENLRILKEFIRICNDNNIWYCLSAGTMLGAVRHDGFIPWDRDVDVYIKIKDVPKVRRIFAENLPDNCEYYGRGVSEGYTSTHELLQSKIVPEAHLDMYPLVGAPSVEQEQAKFTRKTYVLRKLFKSKHVKLGMCLPKNRPLVFVAKLIDLFISDKMIHKTYQRWEKAYPYDNAEFVIALANYGKASNCMRKELFDTLIEHKFETLSCKIPADYHTYLTRMYGDYMTPKRY